MKIDPYSKNLRTMLERHPRPWRVGERHESACWIVDATNKRVCTMNDFANGGGIMNTYDPRDTDMIDLIGSTLVEAINRIELPRIIVSP